MPRNLITPRTNVGHTGEIHKEHIQTYLVNADMNTLHLSVDEVDQNGKLVNDNRPYDFDTTQIDAALVEQGRLLKSALEADGVVFPQGYEITALLMRVTHRDALYWLLSSATGSSRNDPIV